MDSLRHHLHRHRWLAAWLVGAALLIKVLVPAGFMPGTANGMMLIQLCTGQGAQTVMMEIPGKAGDHEQDNHKKADMPCAFAGLSTPSLAATDPVLLAIALAFIIVSAFRVTPTRTLERGIYLRPPSQGPPATT
jgi:hypothetical protein